MGNPEIQRNPEKIPTPDEIDTWVFSQYRIDVMFYLRGLGGDEIEEENESKIFDKLGVDISTYQTILRHLKGLTLQDGKNEEILAILGKLNQLKNPIYARDMYQIYYDYPTFRSILLSINPLPKIPHTSPKNVLSPPGICFAVRQKFFRNISTELLFDEVTQKSILVIYEGKGKQGKLHIYDPLASLREEDTITIIEETNPEESMERERNFRNEEEGEEEESGEANSTTTYIV